MNNNINESKINILCQKCPLIPIINITSTKEGTLIYEYRCPSFHMGLARLEDIISNKNINSRNYGCKCDICKLEIENIPHQEKYKFCGFCKKFICKQCLIRHKKIYSHHMVLNYSKINFLCLYHGKKYKFYCFTCLRSICPKCFGHDNHCVKPLNEIEPNENFLSILNYSFDEVYEFFNSVKDTTHTHFNMENYNNFKRRNIILLNFVKDLYKIYLQKKEANTLNGEIIINFLNLSKFNFNSKNYYSNPNLFYKSHLILNSNPVSSICSFSYTKASFKVGELSPVFFKDLNVNENEFQSMFVSRMDYDLIAYNIGNKLYFMKNDEKIYYKVDVQEKIKNFFQLKKHIICICSEENIYFYKLIKLEPYIIPFFVLMPQISNIIQVYGCIYNALYIINYNYIYKLKQKNCCPNSDYDFALEIENFIKIERENFECRPKYKFRNRYPDNILNLNDNYININNNIDSRNRNNNNNNKKSYNDNDNNNNNGNDNNIDNNNDSHNENKNNNKIETINLNEEANNDNIENLFYSFEEKEQIEYKSLKAQLFVIKGLVYNFLVLKEKNYITLRNENDLIKRKIFNIKSNKKDFIIYNCHILLPEGNEIAFYSIPDFNKVSKVKVSENINYLLIPNKCMLLVIGESSIEQFELNTWKKISKLNRIKIPNLHENSTLIGNTQELYLFIEGVIIKFETNSSENYFY